MPGAKLNYVFFPLKKGEPDINEKEEISQGTGQTVYQIVGHDFHTSHLSAKITRKVSRLSRIEVMRQEIMGTGVDENVYCTITLLQLRLQTLSRFVFNGYSFFHRYLRC